MKKQFRLFALLTLAVLLLTGAALAEGTVTVYGQTFDANLEVLDLDAAGIVAKNNISTLDEVIPQMPNLTEVRMYNSTLTQDQMDHLFDTYRHVFFGWTLKIGKQHTVLTSQTAFSTLHGAKHQMKRDVYHTSKELSVLRYCKYMKAVDIGHNSLGDLSFLADMPQLKVLIIASCYGIKDISVLSNLTELEYLEIFGTKVKDLSPLASLTKLRDLNAAYLYGVKDLTPLDNLPLERFMGAKLNVKDKQKAAFEAAHPNCQTDWKSAPSLGKWRAAGSHYDTIYKMFHEMVYYPFED